MKRILGRLAAIVLLTGGLIAPAAAATAGGPITMCVGPDLGAAACEVYVDAQLTRAYANGPVRVYGWVWTQGQYYGLTLNITIEIGNTTVFINSEKCSDFADTCSSDHTYPCERDCIGSGWYWLTVSAFKDSKYLGTATDSTYIICTI